MPRKPKPQYNTPEHIIKVMPPHLDPTIYGKYFNELGQKQCWMCKHYKDPINDFYRKGRETRCKKCDAIKKKRARHRTNPPQYVINERLKSPIDLWLLRRHSLKNIRRLAKRLGISIRQMYVQAYRSGIDKAWYDK